MKLQWKNAGGRKSKQHFNHSQYKPLSVQSAVGGARQESDSTVTNEHAGTDHQASKTILVCEELAISHHNGRKNEGLKIFSETLFVDFLISDTLKGRRHRNLHQSR